MKLRGYWVIALLTAIVCLCSVGWTAQKEKLQKKTWEYKFVAVSPELEKRFNELGEQGWELVLYQPDIQSGNTVRSASEYCFKRAK